MTEAPFVFTPDPCRNYVRVECWMCHGRGFLAGTFIHCPNCAGNGTVLEEREKRGQ